MNDAHNTDNFPKPSQEELKAHLTEEEYKVTQEEATEMPFTNKYYNNKETGIYVDVVSGEPLFLSIDKYDSGSGWPAFVKPVNADAVTLHTDTKLHVIRTEVKSGNAKSHLGHVFDDGPKERGGKRYCINSASMRFVPLALMKEEGYGDYVKQLLE